jgi:3-oxoacyl-[acyl-carrier protein] reductase
LSMKPLSESIAIVTGASSGIGRATALALARKGARLALAGRSPEALKTVVREAREAGVQECLAKSVDIQDESQVIAFVSGAIELFGSIDVLINSAGLSINGEVDGYATASWQTVIQTNLTGTFLTCRAVLPTMKRQRSGQIINISSGAGHNGIREMSAYCASKFGVIGFTESLALEVRNANIRVSTLSPGSVATNFSARSRGTVADRAQESSAMTASEVAAVVLAMLEQPDQAWMSEVILRPLNLELRRRTD